MTLLRRATARTFHSLTIRNYRLYFIGQIVSMSGTWMQTVAQSWLVLKLTNSAFALGLTVALQFLPVLLFGAWGGVIADRFDKRRALLVTQSLMGTLALILGLLTATGTVRLWMVYLLAGAFGMVAVFDIPARQSFVVEMVGPEDLTNAVGLNSTIFTASRVIGPAIAGLLIARVGLSWCFLINAASYLGVLAGLIAMDQSKLMRRAPVSRAKGQLMEGLRYVRSTPILLWSLLMMAVVGTLTFNYQVLLPLFAKNVFKGDASTFGLLSSVLGVGAVVGALVSASRRQPSVTVLIVASLVAGVALILGAAAPTIQLEMAALIVIGAFSIIFISTSNSMLQLNSADHMRGRVMALYSVVFVGSAPIGGPIVGWIAQQSGPRSGFLVGGLSAILVSAVAFTARLRIARRARLVTSISSDSVDFEPTAVEHETAVV
ncbi:MAG: MFS transporter [Actinomycetota bacterium]|nr:MFS transporter [Actinomycetota bacterium]